MDAAASTALWEAYQDLRSVAGDARIGYDLPTVTDGRGLASIRFGDAVWLCRALEVAAEAFRGAKPAPFDYAPVGAAKNLPR